MPKVSPTTAPDFTEDERKWIEQHPVWRVVFMLVRLALMPGILAAIAGYFEYKSSHNDDKTEAAYKTMAPKVDTTQTQVEALTKQVDLLQKLVLVLVQNGGSKPAEPVVGTLGHGAGGGSGQGYGSGAGHLGGAHAASEDDARVQSLVEMQTSARERKDVVALNCITEKLRLVRTATRHAPEMIPRLVREARQCVGQAATTTAVAAAPKLPSKAALVEELQHTKVAPFNAKPLPKSANDALQQMTK